MSVIKILVSFVWTKIVLHAQLVVIPFVAHVLVRFISGEEEHPFVRFAVNLSLM
jgi:hypothetical protein